MPSELDKVNRQQKQQQTEQQKKLSTARERARAREGKWEGGSKVFPCWWHMNPSIKVRQYFTLYFTELVMAYHNIASHLRGFSILWELMFLLIKINNYHMQRWSFIKFLWKIPNNVRGSARVLRVRSAVQSKKVTLECALLMSPLMLLLLLLLLGQFAQRIKFKFLDCLVEWQPKLGDIRATLSSADPFAICA